MYSSNFVVAILVNGQIVAEDKGGVATIPFGCEYTIRLRNKHSRRAVAKVSIDGDNVTEGGIIVQGHSYVDLERSTEKAVKFKFVSAESAEAIDFGKNNKTDGSNGVVKVDWYLEKEYVPPPQVYVPMFNTKGGGSWRGGVRTQSMGPCGQSFGGEAMNFAGEEKTSGRMNLEGCTVDGSYSSQSFRTQHIDLESTYVTIILTLRGFNPNAAVSTEGKFCTKCGSKVAQPSNFCGICGQRLSKKGKRNV